LFPLRRQLPAPFNDPPDAFGFVGTADICARIAEAAQNRDHPRGALEARSFTFIFSLDLRADAFHEFRRNPATRRFAFGHLLGGLETQYVNVSEERFLEAPVVKIELELSKFLSVETELSNGVIRSGGKLLFQFQVLVGAIRFRILKR